MLTAEVIFDADQINQVSIDMKKDYYLGTSATYSGTSTMYSGIGLPVAVEGTVAVLDFSIERPSPYCLWGTSTTEEFKVLYIHIGEDHVLLTVEGIAFNLFFSYVN